MNEITFKKLKQVPFALTSMTAGEREGLLHTKLPNWIYPHPILPSTVKMSRFRRRSSFSLSLSPRLVLTPKMCVCFVVEHKFTVVPKGKMNKLNNIQFMCGIPLIRLTLVR